MADYLSGLNSGSRGMSGLASGMDTQSMVDKMLAGTKMKIQKEQAAKQKLIWKQQMYRTTIKSLQTIQKSFLSFTNPKTNLMSSEFYNTMSTSYTSKAIRATATTGANVGRFVIDKIDQIATSSKLEATHKATAELSGEIDLQALADAGGSLKVKIDLDGMSKEITLSAAAVDGFAAGSAEAFERNLQNSIKKAHGNAITADVSETAAGSGKYKLQLSTVANEGRQVTVGNVEENEAAMRVMGMKSGQSDKLNGGLRLEDLNLAKPLMGSSFEFTINGKTITATKDDSLNKLMQKINSSGAGVNVSYSAVTDKFTMVSQETGSGKTIEMSQKTGNLLDALFGAGGTQGVGGEKLHVPNLTAGDPLNAAELSSYGGGKFYFTLNGEEGFIELEQLGEGKTYTPKTMIEEINKKLKAFGVDDKGVQNIKLEGTGPDADNPTGVKFVTNKSCVVGISDKNVSDSGITKNLGFKGGQTQAVTKDTKLGDLPNSVTDGIIRFNDKDGNLLVAVNMSDFKDVSLDVFATALQEKLVQNGAAGAGVAFDETTGALQISGITDAITITGQDEQGNAALKELFGNSDIRLGNAPATNVTTDGQNAKLTVNGVYIERNSNSFSIEGMDIEVLSTSAEAIDITASRDTDQIYKGIESFVTEYNKLIDTLNSQLIEKDQSREYTPLTDEQKKDMSEKEIEAWETKAKSGLIRNDSLISGIVSELRMALYQKPSDGKFGLYQIGITTSTNYKDKGKLVISDPDALKAAIAGDTEEVRKLFNGAIEENGKGSGVATMINDIINKSTKESSGGSGSLVEIAGYSALGDADTVSSMGKQLKSYDDRIATLKRSYESEYDRYWRKFNAMEQTIQNMNSQSAWLTQQLG